jgi:hypothetical protein
MITPISMKKNKPPSHTFELFNDERKTSDLPGRKPLGKLPWPSIDMK